jgi:hypothetical protein
MVWLLQQSSCSLEAAAAVSVAVLWRGEVQAKFCAKSAKVVESTTSLTNQQHANNKKTRFGTRSTVNSQ